MQRIKTHLAKARERDADIDVEYSMSMGENNPDNTLPGLKFSVESISDVRLASRSRSP